MRSNMERPTARGRASRRPDRTRRTPGPPLSPLYECSGGWVVSGTALRFAGRSPGSSPFGLLKIAPLLDALPLARGWAHAQWEGRWRPAEGRSFPPQAAFGGACELAQPRSHLAGELARRAPRLP